MAKLKNQEKVKMSCQGKHSSLLSSAFIEADGHVLTHKYQTSLKRLTWGKHSKLFCPIVLDTEGFPGQTL
jgi:hypothetical protein